MKYETRHVHTTVIKILGSYRSYPKWKADSSVVGPAPNWWQVARKPACDCGNVQNATIKMDVVDEKSSIASKSTGPPVASQFPADLSSQVFHRCFSVLPTAHGRDLYWQTLGLQQQRLWASSCCRSAEAVVIGTLSHYWQNQIFALIMSGNSKSQKESATQTQIYFPSALLSKIRPQYTYKPRPQQL